MIVWSELAVTKGREGLSCIRNLIGIGDVLSLVMDDGGHSVTVNFAHNA